MSISRITDGNFSVCSKDQEKKKKHKKSRSAEFLKDINQLHSDEIGKYVLCISDNFGCKFVTSNWMNEV